MIAVWLASLLNWLQLPANSNYFLSICILQELHVTCYLFGMVRVFSRFLGVFPSFRPFVNVFCATLLNAFTNVKVRPVDELGLKLSRFKAKYVQQSDSKHTHK